MRILLADDSRAMRTMYRTVLEKLGHSGRDILEAKEGPEVLAALQNRDLPVDLIVFDWDLPGLDGLAFLSQIKNLGLSGKVNVLYSVSRQQRATIPQVARLASGESIDRPFTEEMFEMKIRGLGTAVAVKKAGSSSRVGAVAPLPEADSGIPFLLRLPSAAIDDLLKMADERQHAPGTVLLRAGQVCDALHILTRGEVEVLAGGRPVRAPREGDPFGEFSFMMSEPSPTTVRAKTTVVTASLSKARISDLLRKHPSLDQHLSSLMGRHQEAMTVRATTILQSDFKGTFDTMPFANVIQVLNVGRKTGVLGIRDDYHSGGIYFDNGEAVHAWTDDAKGDKAFYALARWSKAKFAFTSQRRGDARTLQKPTLTLLMEAMRRQEENSSGTIPTKDVGLDQLFPSQ